MLQVKMRGLEDTFENFPDRYKAIFGEFRHPLTRGRITAEMRDLHEDFGDDSVGFADYFDPSGWLDIPTGAMPYVRRGEGAAFAWPLVLLHGRVWTMRRTPSLVELVGGCPPF